MADSAALEEKDVPMEDVTEVDEDELLGTKAKNGEELDESMKEIKLEGEAAAAVATESTTTDGAGGEEKKEEEEKVKKDDDDDDGGAASDIEFATEDDRTGATSGK